jgi:hypothetical protein
MTVRALSLSGGSITFEVTKNGAHTGATIVLTSGFSGNANSLTTAVSFAPSDHVGLVCYRSINSTGSMTVSAVVELSV